MRVRAKAERTDARMMLELMTKRATDAFLFAPLGWTDDIETDMPLQSDKALRSDKLDEN